MQPMSADPFVRRSAMSLLVNGRAGERLGRIADDPLLTLVSRVSILGLLAFLALDLRAEVQGIHAELESLKRDVVKVTERLDQRIAAFGQGDAEQNRRIGELEAWRLATGPK